MAKRFTDTKKWRNEWFRTLPMKAKLTWAYLCDECEFYGVWKPDYGLASFQLDFKVSKEDLIEWFGDKIFLLPDDKVLIVPFFEFQYGESKDTWSVKAKARERLEQLGFQIVDNQVQTHIPPTSGGHRGDIGTDALIKDKGSHSKEKGGVGEKTKFDFESVYKTYPLRVGGTLGIERLREIIKTPEEFEQFKTAVARYRADCEKKKTEPDKIKHFSSFVGTKTRGQPWRDWVDPNAGQTTLKPQNQQPVVEDW